MAGVHTLVIGEAIPELGAVIAERGHAAVHAATARGASDALAHGPTPDVVIVVAADAVGAVEVVRAVRGLVRGEVAPLLAVIPEAAVEAALDAGANLALPSPVPVAQLRAALASGERAAARLRAATSPSDPAHDLYFTKNPHPMWFFDVDTLAFVAVNDAAVQKYGWTRDELLRMTLRDIRPEEELARLVERTGRVATGLDRSTGWHHRARDGRIFHVDIISYPVRFAGRACKLVLAHDVSQRVAAERAVEELRAQVALSDRMASLGTMAAGVAHEINTPLTFVLANLAFADERLAASPREDAAALREALAEAADGARRVQSIIGDLKSFSRRAEAEVGPVDLPRIVASAVALAANELRHRARVELDVAGAPPVLATEARLGQVLLNLLLNAAQAVPEGDANANVVSVIARADGDRVRVDVSDTGGGVPEDVRQRIFDPFFTTKRIGEGTGLGLWVSRRIATDLGGTLELVPGAGRGATFRVTLPVARSPSPAPAPPPARAAPPSPRPRVLVIDDEPLVGRALQRALRAEAEVEVEVSARKALERLTRGERFDLVVSDVMMPELPALQLHAALERLDPALARSVVFMTGGAFAAQEAEFLARIPNVCLEKPIDLQRLRALLRGP
jgi:PAS domain S-box-containing protein